MFQLVTNARIATVLERRPRQRQQDAPEEAEPAAAVDRRGVLQLARDRAHERPQDDDRDRERERRLGERDAERVLEQAEVAQQQVQRQDRHAEREQQPEREERVDALAAAERRSGTARTPPSTPSATARTVAIDGDQRAVADQAPERRRT